MSVISPICVGNLGFSFKDQLSNILLNLFFGTVVNAARGISVQVGSLIKKGKYPISLILISVLTSISYLISNYLALYPPDNMLTFANIYFFFILPVFLWYSLDSRKYMIYCLQLLSGCMLFACVYSIIEVLFNKNIIQDVLLSLFDL
jgi:hypothetical protein